MSMTNALGLGITMVPSTASGGGGVPALAIRDRAGNPILDRFGAYILSRV
jgi:hypothetical protein